MSYQQRTSRFTGNQGANNAAGDKGYSKGSAQKKEMKPTTHYMVEAKEVAPGDKPAYVNAVFIDEVITKDGRTNLKLNVKEGIAPGTYFINKKKTEGQ